MFKPYIDYFYFNFSSIHISYFYFIFNLLSYSKNQLKQYACKCI